MNLAPANSTIVSATELPKEPAAREQLVEQRLSYLLGFAEPLGAKCVAVDTNGNFALPQTYGNKNFINIGCFRSADPFDWETRQSFLVSEPPVHLQFAAGSSRLLTRLEGRIQVWNLNSDLHGPRPQCIISVRSSDLVELSAEAVLHPSGNYLFIATKDHHLTVFEICESEGSHSLDLRHKYKLLGEAKDIIFSPSGEKMALVLAEILEGRHLRYCVTVVGTHPKENGHIPPEVYKNKIGVYSPDSSVQVEFHGRHDAPFVHDNISINVPAMDAHRIDKVSFDPTETQVSIKVKNVSGETILELKRY